MDPHQVEVDNDPTAAHFAALVAGNLTEVEKSVMRGSRVSKSPVIDPRKLLPKNVQGAARRPAQSPQIAPGHSVNDVAPRINLIPTPQGIDPTVIAKMVTESENPAPVQTVQAPTSTQQEQLEFDFNKQAQINELFDQLEAMKVEVKAIRSLLEKIYAANTESDKKKLD